MSDQSTVLTTAHLEYVATHTAGDDDFLLQLKDAARAADIPQIWVAPEQASFMAIVLRSCNARRVIEVGTLAGYAAIVMARALPPEGRLLTIELDSHHAAFAREWIGRSDVADRVELLEGPADDLLSDQAAASADAMFIDADKENYSAYLAHAERVVRPGGILLADNAFAFGQLLEPQPCDDGVPHIRAFNERLARSQSFDSVIVPIGDGCWLGVRR